MWDVTTYGTVAAAVSVLIALIALLVTLTVFRRSGARVRLRAIAIDTSALEAYRDEPYTSWTLLVEAENRGRTAITVHQLELIQQTDHHYDGRIRFTETLLVPTHGPTLPLRLDPNAIVSWQVVDAITLSDGGHARLSAWVGKKRRPRVTIRKPTPVEQAHKKLAVPPPELWEYGTYNYGRYGRPRSGVPKEEPGGH